jgi:hypothetical protein
LPAPTRVALQQAPTRAGGLLESVNARTSRQAVEKLLLRAQLPDTDSTEASVALMKAVTDDERSNEERSMVLATWQVGQVLWSMVWLGLLFMFIWVAVAIVIDLIRSRDLSGWAKALWTIFIIFLPWLGLFVYLVARGSSMGDRRIGESYGAQQSTGPIASPSAPSPTADLAALVDLHSRGVIDDLEFQTAKRQIVAP